MRAARIILVVLSFGLLAAHFSRAEEPLLVAVSLAGPFLLIGRGAGTVWLLRIALVAGSLEWVRTLVRLMGERRALGEPWARLAIILGVVALLTLLAGLAVPRRRPKSAAVTSD